MAGGFAPGDRAVIVAADMRSAAGRKQTSQHAYARWVGRTVTVQGPWRSLSARWGSGPPLEAVEVLIDVDDGGTVSQIVETRHLAREFDHGGDAA